VHVAIFLILENDMGIVTKSFQAAKSLVRRQLLKREERQLLKEIRTACAELEYHPDRRVYYQGEYLPSLELQLQYVRAKLRKAPAPRTALGNVHGRAASIQMSSPAQSPQPRAMNCAATTTPAWPSIKSGGSRFASASHAQKPSPNYSSSASPTQAHHAC
jgi:hypothetical protein